MKRSEINRYLREAVAFFESFRFPLPPWAGFSLQDWRAQRNCQEIFDCRLGWDLTSFGSDDFQSNQVAFRVDPRSDPRKIDLRTLH